MVDEKKYRRIFDAAINRASRNSNLSDAAKEAALLGQLSEEFRVACSALRDSFLDRGLPGYPVVVHSTWERAPERAYFIGCWTDDDEYDTSDDWEPFTVHTFVLLTSGMATQARWDPDRHAFVVASEPAWLELALRHDYSNAYRLVSRRTPFDCGNLIEHLTAVATAGGRFYRYGADLCLADQPRDVPVPWERPRRARRG